MLRLSPLLQSIAFEQNKMGLRVVRSVRTLKSRDFTMIERRASLDALAYLIILLREANDLGEQQLAFDVATARFRLEQRSVTTELFNLFVERIFPLTNGGWPRLLF